MKINVENKKISEMKKAFNGFKDFFRLPRVGEKIEGKVLSISSNSILLDISPVGTGIILARELYDGLGTSENLKIGDKVTATVLEQENENGYVELSLKEASYEKVWQDLKEKMKGKKVIPTKILEANRGGLMAEINGVIGFLPVSCLSPHHYPRVKNGDKEKILSILNGYVNQIFKVEIIDIDQEQEKLILSEKPDKTDEIDNIEKFKLGDVIEGEVKDIVDFGAFVEFGDNLEGLIHISELGWQIVDNPNDIVKVGEKVKAKIIGIDKRKISLSLKALQEDPWKKAAEKYKVGQIIDGQVTKINQFGAFVQLDKYIHGLVHISELKKYKEKNKNKLIEETKKYKFKILSFEPKEHRLGLSLV